MATGSILTLLPQHPTFQKVVLYFNKFHLNTMEHQGPSSCPCIWFIWAAVECHASTKSKMKQDCRASREAQVHRFKQGANITSTSRLWLLTPCSAEESRINSKGRTARKGRAWWWQSPTLHAACWRRWEQEIEKCNNSSEHLLSVPLPTHFLFLSPFLVSFETANICPGPLQPELKASQREWTLHSAKDLSLSCLKI